MSSSSPSYFKTTGLTVTTEKLEKNYRTAAEEIHALNGVDFQLKPGQAVAIMGPSGCGKTTLLNLLGGVDRPTQGKIRVDGQDLTQASERDLETYRLLKVGFVFQLFNLVPSMTAFENLELPLMVAGKDESECSERIHSLLRMVGLEAKGRKLPGELSGGEQQRVAVALALANDPSLILADEPTGNLDSSNASMIASLLRSLATDYGKTVLMVSHDQKVVEEFPIVYFMRDGRFSN